METIIGALLSGVVAVIVSTIYYRRYEHRKAKLDTLKRFAAYRYDVKGEEFSRALNEIFIAFVESRDVLKALSDYHEKVTAKQASLDHLVKLFKAMCNDLNIAYDQFNDSFFLCPFNTRQSCADHSEK